MEILYYDPRENQYLIQLANMPPKWVPGEKMIDIDEALTNARNGRNNNMAYCMCGNQLITSNNTANAATSMTISGSMTMKALDPNVLDVLLGKEEAEKYRKRQEQLKYQQYYEHLVEKGVYKDMPLRNSGRYPWNTENGDKRLEIVDVITHNNRVVIVKFGDGSFTKSVCSENDTFDIDVGITICLLKKMLGGTKDYNKLIRAIHSMMDEKEAEKQKAAEEKKAARAKREKLEQKRITKREEAIQEYRDDISDAVYYAMKRLEEEKRDDA